MVCSEGSSEGGEVGEDKKPIANIPNNNKGKE